VAPGRERAGGEGDDGENSCNGAHHERIGRFEAVNLALENLLKRSNAGETKN
jgi:hypothetical protein